MVKAVLRGSLGFAAVSLAAYAVWGFAGSWLSATLKEGGFYAVMAVVFLGLSGLALHRLVEGPNPLPRFYKAFVPAFIAYSAVWCASWFALGWGKGEWLGSVAGTAAFAGVLGWSFGNLKPFPRAALVLFMGHSAGYFLGGPIHYGMKDQRVLGILLWGLVYGLCFGAGIGYAFHAVQRPCAK